MNSEDFILVEGYKHIRYTHETYSEDEMLNRSKNYFEWLNKRRSVRHFSKKPVAIEVIENIINSASTAPSGANKQPWTFCIVQNAALKKKIRKAAEEEERTSYQERMSDEWLEDLKHLPNKFNNGNL